MICVAAASCKERAKRTMRLNLRLIACLKCVMSATNMYICRNVSQSGSLPNHLNSDRGQQLAAQHKRLSTLALLLSTLLAITLLLVRAAPVAAQSYSYDDLPAAPIPLDENNTVLCNEPLVRTIDVTDSFLVTDLNVGLAVDHSYRSDVRLVLQSPTGTRIELMTEFALDPEDVRDNYDILLDSEVSDLLNAGGGDDTSAPFFERRAAPFKSLTIFNGEQAQGIWTLEICDAGLEDSGRYQRSQLAFTGSAIAAGPTANTIRGLVYRDYNADGARSLTEPGIAAITATAYDEQGAVVASATSDAQGRYQLGVADGRAVRIEFTNLPAYLQPGAAGADSDTTVAFVTSPVADLDLALANPGQHCQNSTTTALAFPCNMYGAGGGLHGQKGAVLRYAEDDGTYALVTQEADTVLYDGTPTTLATHAEVGALWGMVYDRQHDRLLGASTVKRHADLGSTGNPTTIYAIDPDTQGATPWFTLDAGRANPHGAVTEWAEDFAAFGVVSKEGWGDIDLADDGRTLYGVDLGTRQLAVIPIMADGHAGNATTVDIIDALPADIVGPGVAQCPTATDLRPYGLGVNDGVLYVGVICTAQSTVDENGLPIQAPTKTKFRGTPPGAVDKLRAYILAWNNSTATPAFSPVLDFALDYSRGCATNNQSADCGVRYAGEWLPWVDQFPYSSDGTRTPAGTESFEAFYPQPLLSNIEFYNGSMVLFLFDRFGQQVGSFTESPYGETLNHVATHGDILYACRRNDGSWVMEELLSGDPSCGTAGQAFIEGKARVDEYFFEDTYRARYALHGDVGLGAGLAIPGRNTVISAIFDPVYATDIKGDTLFDGGLHWYSVADGHWRKSVRVYNNLTGNISQEGTFAKAVGLGDIVALCDPAPVEIGNRVWRDENSDGLQSPSEAGLAHVTVELFCPATGADGIPGNGDDALPLASAVTDAAGHYFFSSATGQSTPNARFGLKLLEGAACTVRIPNVTGGAQQSALSGLNLTEQDDQRATTSGNDQNDSDGAPVGSDAVVDFTVGAAGHNNHTYDFGFMLKPLVHSLGNQVWLDADNNTVRGGGEVAVPGVALSLYNPNGTPADRGDDTLLAQTQTTADGLYLFTDLPAGDYYVGVDETNFAPTGPLAGCVTANEALDEDNANADVDNNDNGSLFANQLYSSLVTLGADEPLGEKPDNDNLTLDNQENLTVDFGFYCVHSLGNQVWLDANDNAQREPAELTLPNIALELYTASGTPQDRQDDFLLGRTQSQDDGLYLFAGLPTGAYYVKVLESNFVPGAALYGCRSSSAAVDEDDPNLDLDNNDNGQQINAETLSALLRLGNDEPLGETPDNDPMTPDAQENLTLDFGFYCPYALGNQLWLDPNNNGLINGGEPGLPGVTLTLYGPGNDPADPTDDVKLGQTISGPGGLYLFPGLPIGDYYVVIDPPNFAPGGGLAGCLSSATFDESDPNQDQDGNDNGLLIGGNVQSGLVTLGGDEPLGEVPTNAPNADGRNNLTVDFGFYCPHSLGNQVWFDRNNNAQIDPAEPGIVGVALSLFADGGTPTEPSDDYLLMQSTTTQDGLYLFTGLPVGTYYVQLDQSNYQGTGELVGCVSSDAWLDEDEPDTNGDNNDNGLQVGNLVRSGLITLGNNEPLGENPDNDGVTPDAQENLTVDFGCFVTLSLGNRVWIDDGAGGGLANNGLRDGSERGVANVILALLDGNKAPVLNTQGQAITTTTDVAGYYLFNDLLPGNYVVQILPRNFQLAGPLAGYLSSEPTEQDPNQNGDTNDNGIDSPTPITAGIYSNLITLDYTFEPTQEDDPGGPPDRALDPNSNITVDFGFFAVGPTNLAEPTEPRREHAIFLPFVLGQRN